MKQTLALGHRDSLKVSLTTKEGAQAKRPHQAFLVLREAASGLEAPFALTVKESGKGSVQIVRFCRDANDGSGGRERKEADQSADSQGPAGAAAHIANAARGQHYSRLYRSNQGLRDGRV